MVVDPVGPADPVTNLKGIDQTARPQPSSVTDSVNLSQEARSVGDLYAATEIANNSPDVRAELVAEIKGKLQDPNYITASIIDQVADRIADPIGT